MKVSIVTISFNQAAFLEKTLISVLNQDYESIEYIVVDPGSTDGSREVLEKFRPRIAHLILEPDKGPADGLNKGFQHASGDIFGYLNSDDILTPNAIKEVVAYFKNNPGIDVVSGNAYVIDEQGNELRKTYSDPFSLVRYAYRACIVVQQSTFFRASAFRRAGGFNPGNVSCWDGELLVAMKLTGSTFGRANRIWSGFRLHSGSITSTKRLYEKLVADHRRIFRNIMNRSVRPQDELVRLLFRLSRYVINPRDLLERITHGPIAGRHEKDYVS